MGNSNISKALGKAISILWQSTEASVYPLSWIQEIS